MGKSSDREKLVLDGAGELDGKVDGAGDMEGSSPGPGGVPNDDRP